MSRGQALHKVPGSVPFLARIGMDGYDISYSSMIDALSKLGLDGKMFDCMLYTR